MRPAHTPPGPHEAELRRAVADVRDAEVMADMARGWRTAIANLDEADNRLRRAMRGLRDNDQLGSHTREAALSSFRAMRGYIDEQRTVFTATARALDKASDAMARAVQIVEKWDRQGPFLDPGPAPQPDPNAAPDSDQTAYIKALSEHSGRVAAHSSSTAGREEEARVEMAQLSERFRRSEDKIREAHDLPAPFVRHPGGCLCEECHPPGCGCSSCRRVTGCPRCHAAICVCPPDTRCPRCLSRVCRCEPERCPTCRSVVCRCESGPEPERCPRCSSSPCRCHERVETCPRCFSSPCRCERRVDPPHVDPPHVDPPHVDPHKPQVPVTSVAGDPQSSSYQGSAPGGSAGPGPGLGSGPSAGAPGGHLPGGAAPIAMGGAGAPGMTMSGRGAAPIGGAAGGQGAGAAGRAGGAGGGARAGGAGGAAGARAGGAAGARAGGAGARAGAAGARGAAGRGAGAAGAAGGRGGRGGRGDKREGVGPNSELLADDSDWLDGEETAPGVLG